jgi:hypothetical protein
LFFVVFGPRKLYIVALKLINENTMGKSWKRYKRRNKVAEVIEAAEVVKPTPEVKVQPAPPMPTPVTTPVKESTPVAAPKQQKTPVLPKTKKTKTTYQ